MKIQPWNEGTHLGVYLNQNWYIYSDNILINVILRLSQRSVQQIPKKLYLFLLIFLSPNTQKAADLFSSIVTNSYLIMAEEVCYFAKKHGELIFLELGSACSPVTSFAFSAPQSPKLRIQPWIQIQVLTEFINLNSHVCYFLTQCKLSNNFKKCFIV